MILSALLLISLISLSAPSQLRGEELGLLTFDTDTERTSDDFARTSFRVRQQNHRRNLLWPYPEEMGSAWDWGYQVDYHTGQVVGENFSGFALTGLLGRKFSPSLYLEGRYGAHQLFNHKERDFEVQPTYAAELFYLWKDLLSVRAEIKRDFLYHEMVLPGGLINKLKSTDLLMTAGARWIEKIRTQAILKMRQFSDSNSMQQIDLSAAYGIFTGDLWLWTGVGFEQLGFGHLESSYWSPSQFQTFGPRVEFAAPIYGKWSTSVGLNVNRWIDRDQGVEGWGHYGSARLQYERREETHFALKVTHLQSNQGGSAWNSQSLGFDFTTFF